MLIRVPDDYPDLISAVNAAISSGLTEDTQILFTQAQRMTVSCIFPYLPDTGKTLTISGANLFAIGSPKDCTIIVSGSSFTRGRLVFEDILFGSETNHSYHPFVYTEKNANVWFLRCKFLNNHFNYANVLSSPCVFESCEFRNLNGAAFCQRETEFYYCYIENCGNEAAKLYALHTFGNVVNCTFNNSNYFIKILGTRYFINNLVWNSQNSGSYVVDVADTVRCYNNDVDKMLPAGLHQSGNDMYSSGNISADPLFTVPPIVSPVSPVIDAGFSTYDFLKPFDYFGRYIVDSQVDIGCYEYLDLACSLLCETSLQSYCDNVCEVHCQNACEHTCQYRCELNCEQDCQVHCQYGCEMSCRGDCQNTSCQFYCQILCQTKCQDSCQMYCTSLCQSSSCQGRCQSTTEGNP